MIEPYYKTELGTVYCGDCLEVMEQFKENEFDLVLTDPPYGINVMSWEKNKSSGGRKYEFVNNYGFIKWDNEIPSKENFIKILKISKNQIIFGGNYFIEYLKNSPCWIVWDKFNSGDFADCELAWTSFKTAIRKFTFKWNGIIQEDPRIKYREMREHPNQKPAGLFLGILEKYSKETDYILDCYAGSGTTGVACERLNSRYVLIEKEEKYCQIIKERLTAETKQRRLF